MKKLASVLALTAVVANLGLATVFAADTAGTQVIGCDYGNTVTLTTPNAINFADKTTNFTADTTDAGLQADLTAVVNDQRGFDPDPGFDCSGGTGAGADHTTGAMTLTIQSPGLTKDARTGGSAVAESLDSPTLHMTVDNTGVAINKTSGVTMVPDTLSSIATLNTAADHAGLIDSAKTLVNYTESFSGSIDSVLHAADLVVSHDKITYGAGTTTYLSAGQPIPAGTYHGTITFTLTGVK